MSGAEPCVACAIAMPPSPMQARRHAEPADDPGCFVAEDVPEHVRRDHRVEALRVAYQAHREGVDDHLVDRDVRKVVCRAVALFDEHPAPELEYGVLVNQRQTLAPLAGDLEGGSGHAIAAL